MKRQKQFRKSFGIDETGLINFPVKISNVQISRIIHGNLSGCSWCFPHGWETDNSTVFNRQRNWKRFRKTRWKSKRRGLVAQTFSLDRLNSPRKGTGTTKKYVLLYASDCSIHNYEIPSTYNFNFSIHRCVRAGQFKWQIHKY